VDVVGYPDSGKMAVAAGVANGDFKTATLEALGRVVPAGSFDGKGG
jgi:hypothetical protein